MMTQNPVAFTGTSASGRKTVCLPSKSAGGSISKANVENSSAYDSLKHNNILVIKEGNECELPESVQQGLKEVNLVMARIVQRQQKQSEEGWKDPDDEGIRELQRTLVRLEVKATKKQKTELQR